MPLQTGEQVGDFVIISQIGQGAFGVVYKARDVGMRRLVAIKELVMHRPGLESTDYRAQHKQFEHEVETLSRFSHPNVVAAYQILHDAHADYLVMEYVGGDSLKKLLGTGRPLPVAQAIRIALDLCSAIAEMTRHNIVHRDIKPDNILLTPSGSAKLTDFGIAQLGTTSNRGQPGGSSRTHPGTPRYKSPEQENSSSDLDQRSDLYTLGLVLYEMLTGQSYKAVRKPVRQMNPDVPRALEQALDKALQPDRDKRFQSAQEMEAALLRARPTPADTRPTPAKAVSKPPASKPKARLIYGLMGLGVLAALAVIALILTLSPPGNPAPGPTGGSVIVVTTKATVKVTAPVNAVTPTPSQPEDTLAYPSSLEIVSPNGGAQFYQRDAVELKWKPPANVTTLPTGQVYLIKISYVDSTSGQPQTKTYSATEAAWSLPLADFFTSGTPIAQGDEYSWQVAVGNADSLLVALSPWTEPPYTFQWSANAATSRPPKPTTSVIPTVGPQVIPTATPAPDPNATPVCTGGKVYSPGLGCKDPNGGGDPNPNPVVPPPPPTKPTKD